MVEPMSVLEQQKNEVFKPTKIISIQYAQPKYDSTWKKNDKGKVEQAMKDLGDAVNNDCMMMEEAFKKYGTLEFGPNKEYKLTDDPKEADIKKLKKQLLKDLKRWKNEKVLIVYILASHGI